MEVSIAKAWKAELEKKIAELIKDYEKKTMLQPDFIGFVRQPVCDSLGNETDCNYVVEVKVVL